MNRAIWKYDLDGAAHGIAIRSMPKGAQVLTVQRQGSEVCLWAVGDRGVVHEERTFIGVGTGWTLPDNLGSFQYIGTIQDGAFVWHYFEVTRANGGES